VKNKFKVQSSKFKVYKKTFYLLLLTAYFLLFSLLNSCTSQKEKVYRKSSILMDTVVTITVGSDSKIHAEDAIDKAFSEIEKLGKLFDFYSSESEVSLINKNAGISEQKVSPEVLEILDRALFISEKTGGAFDVTIGPVITLYDFYKKIKPEENDIKRNLPLVNYRELIIDKNKSTVFLSKKGMLVDLGGIAKGYAADKAVETLKRNGIHSGIVSVAGDIKCFGLKPDGKPWKIGIRNPRAEGPEDIMATVNLSDMAISTSGDYERYFILNGKRYHHLVSPKTGHPAEECRSVTVMAKKGVLADAFATGVFILGPERGLKVLEKAGFDGVIVDKGGKIYLTPDIKSKIEFIRTLQK
jgi:thiamine biosynthesis lipoprotein